MAKRKPTKKAKATTSAREAKAKKSRASSSRAPSRSSARAPSSKKEKAKPAKPVKPTPKARKNGRLIVPRPSKSGGPGTPRLSKSGGPGTPRKAQLAKPKKPAIKRARVLSKNPEAIRSRKRREVAKREELKKAKKPARRRAESEAQRRRRRERRGVEDAERAAREKLTGRPKVAPRKKPKKKRGKPPAPTVDEMRELATGWFEQLRDIAATITPTSLDVTDPSGRDLIAPEQEGASRRRRGVGRRPWLVVGRFDFLTPIGYDTVGEVLSAWNDDYILAAAIHPDRLSQIRIIYEDPNETRGDGDDFIAQIGAWSFVVQELVFEILGTGVADEADQDALVLRYAQSIVPRLYVYFSPDLMGGTTIDIGRKVVEKFKL